MTDDEAWNLERQFWTGDAAFYEQALHPACVMVFPPPAGVLPRAAIIEGIRTAPRWIGVDISGQTIARPSAELIVLAYRASATRGEEQEYLTYCSSAYLAAGPRWLLFLHQQTPVQRGQRVLVRSSSKADDISAGASRGMKWPTPGTTRRATSSTKTARSSAEASGLGRTTPSSAP